METVADPYASGQEALARAREVSQLGPENTWYNAETGEVESLTTSPAYQSRIKAVAERAEAIRKANLARERFQEVHGYDRIGTDPEVPGDPFETAPSTPVRAGPGLAVSPTNAAMAAGGAAVMVGSGVALAQSRNPGLSSTQQMPDAPVGSTPGPSKSPSGPSDNIPPLPPLSKEKVAGLVPYSSPAPGFAIPQIYSRRSRRVRRSHFPFLK